MVIDTSAFVAILTGEPDRRRFIESIEAAESRLVSAATFVETAMVIESRYGSDGLHDLDLFLVKAEIRIVPVDVEQAHAARRAFSRFGKGRHRAGLNYGDCFSYALASLGSEPLLFKGDDFPHTDVIAAVPEAEDDDPVITP
jgi:ribonuclease VapC